MKKTILLATLLGALFAQASAFAASPEDLKAKGEVRITWYVEPRAILSKYVDDSCFCGNAYLDKSVYL